MSGKIPVFCFAPFFWTYFVFFAVESIEVGYSEIKFVGRRRGWLGASTFCS